MSTCKFCHDIGKVRCVKCEGKKRIDCPGCTKGKHELYCFDCNGAGYMPCPECKGEK